MMIPLAELMTLLAQSQVEVDAAASPSTMNPMTDVLTYVAGATISTAFVVAFIRLLIGPEVPDRVVALDLMATVAVGAIALLAVRMNNYIFLDAAMVLALIFFLGTIAFAYYLEKKGDTA